LLSEYFGDHTIGRLYRGLVNHLDRGRFEVVLMHAPGSPRDALSQTMEADADKTMVLPAALAAQQAAVADAELDVLFYPDIGMSTSTYFLAYCRLAPVQMASWGHPVTSGLDTVDYFVSATSIEPAGAQEHYTEQIITLNRLPCYYPALPMPNLLPRTALGLPEAGTLYGCPQSLFKIHPDFDAVLAKIAEADPTAHIVLVDGLHGAWKEALQKRWQESFPILRHRVTFLPRMSRPQFGEHLARLDVLLDPIYFGSGNSMYEAMAVGTPIVTWAGPFMRGRIVAGAYAQMGVADAPIAKCLRDYAPLALVLGHSPQRRSALRKGIVEAARKELFDDARAVRAFEEAVERAVMAKAHDVARRRG
jgi:predicted O-linked N-acetylglucosamine transferase (SPINDLY family)